MLGKEPKAPVLKVAQNTASTSIDRLENYFLKDTKYICSDEITVADLQAICELTQYWMVGEHLEAGHPNIERWLKDCQKELNPHFDEVHKWVYFARDKDFFGAKKAKL